MGEIPTAFLVMNECITSKKNFLNYTKFNIFLDSNQLEVHPKLLFRVTGVSSTSHYTNFNICLGSNQLELHPHYSNRAGGKPSTWFPPELVEQITLFITSSFKFPPCGASQTSISSFISFRFLLRCWKFSSIFKHISANRSSS